MDSPSPNPGASAQPLTPPGDGAASHRASTSAPTQQQQQQQSPGPNKTTTGTNNANANPNTTTTTATATTTSNDTLPQFPATSLEDDGKSRRPRDVRLMHMLLASQGVTAYQERVPLQLLDFAYRYTSATLQDAVYLVTEGYSGEAAGGAGRGGEGGGGSSSKVIHHDVNSVSLAAVRMSIASRLHYQFQPSLPKEFLLEMAAERNRVVLPGAVRGADVGGVPPTPTSNSVLMGGIRLPPERFCQTGVGWDMNEEWESEGEEEVEADQKKEGEATGGEGKETKKEKEEDEDEDMMDDDDGDGRMEDIFGDDTMNKDGGGADEDRTMSGM
ncbi:GMP synthase (glutamine-hydrolyzing) [Ascosphaera pollenicola]|nr:GMP synthase (glutamine-hydrolyzing) [Ascosphaera pollenicola]